MPFEDSIQEFLPEIITDEFTLKQIINHITKIAVRVHAIDRNGGLGHGFQVGKKSIYIFGNNQKWKNQNPSHRSIMEVLCDLFSSNFSVPLEESVDSIFHAVLLALGKIMAVSVKNARNT